MTAQKLSNLHNLIFSLFLLMPPPFTRRARSTLGFLVWTLLLLCALAPSAFGQTNAPSVTLAWDPVTDSNLAGYKLHYGSSKGQYMHVIGVGKTNTCTVPGLVGGSNYFFMVTAYNNLGMESDSSNEVLYKASLSNSGAPVLSPVKILTLKPSTGDITLTWATQPGSVYRVVFKPGLSGNGWTDLSSNLTARGTSLSYIDEPGDNEPSRFYSVLSVQ